MAGRLGVRERLSFAEFAVVYPAHEGQVRSRLAAPRHESGVSLIYTAPLPCLEVPAEADAPHGRHIIASGLGEHDGKRRL